MGNPSSNQKDALLQSVTSLKTRWREKLPKAAIICGSGWNECVKGLEIVDQIKYENINCLTNTTVSGHIGNLLLAKTANEHAMVFQGRRHWYEGAGWGPIQQPVLLAKELGCESMILTNAAGGISANLDVGDLMIIKDHINFMGDNPLTGELLHPEIPRFPDQTEIYNRSRVTKLKEIGTKEGIALKEGVYLGLSGPAFETPAEIKAFAHLGANAVGMSTVPESMIANSLGMKVSAISCISNKAAGISEGKLSHEEVDENTSKSIPIMKILIKAFLDEVA